MLVMVDGNPSPDVVAWTGRLSVARDGRRGFFEAWRN